MSINNNTIQNSIHELESHLFHDNIFNENESHPLLLLHSQLQEIDIEPQLTTIDEKRQIISLLNYFQINYLYNFLDKYFSNIPLSILKALFDIIRFQMNINMNIDQSVTDYYFDLSLTYLTGNSTIDYLNSKKETNTNIDELFLNLFSSIGSRSVYIKTNLSYSICVSHKNIPTFFQLNSSTEHLLQSFIVYLNNLFFNNCQQYQSHNSILKWLLTMTNIYGFVPYFVKTNYPNTVLQWMMIKRDQAEHICINLWFFIINLLHNLARHRMGGKALNKLKAIDILKQWKDQYISELLLKQNNENDKDILIAYYLVYAILLEPKELKKENISNIQTVLDYILERTVQAFNSSELCFGPYNICEYLNGLAKFVVNDKFLIYIMSRDNIFNLFIEKFLLFNNIYQSTDLNTIICSSLYTIFWSISFQAEYHAKLKSIENFIQYVEQISKLESIDEHAVMMKRAAKGILFNLDLIEMDVQPIEENINVIGNNQIKLMISYAHKDATFCQKLVTSLQERFQGEIWVDFNKLSAPYEDDWEEIAKAITQCNVILMIVTENYCSSKSCRREVIHADKRNKRMIPIYLGKDYKPEDWFEIRVGSAAWVRFGDKRNHDEVMEILFKLINAQDKIKQNNNDNTFIQKLQTNAFIANNNNQTTQIPLSIDSNPVETVTSSDSIPLSSNSNTLNNVTPTNPIEQWTCEEVQQWLRLPPSVLQLSSGQALSVYMNLLLHEDAQYDEYEHRMRHHGVTREQFANLISSYLCIHSNESILTELPDQWTQKEIKFWFQQNHLSNYLLNILNLMNGSQLITYAELLINSPSRIDNEFIRLQNQIENDLFHLDEYARFLSGLKKLVKQSKL
ncbi:unnamed protein product [Adineta steineri]|uniref:TIR domain-containing protein n=1 Tax=Adineta steineri TaxID=433720 RepID=A0A815YY60_9BILA|nr:unnamed protein product [Adineta steineri]CAF1577773.1 unnamed protein product [Adineta steineri]